MYQTSPEDMKYIFYAVLIIMFVALSLILRFLFGPKGIFKDKNLRYDGEEKTDNNN